MEQLPHFVHEGGLAGALLQFADPNHQLFIGLLQLLPRALALGDVPDDSRKGAFAVDDKFGERDSQGDLRSAFVEAGEFRRLPIDMSSAGLQVSFEPGPVHLAEIFGHQQGETLPEHLRASVTEDPLRSGVDEKNPAFGIDGNEGVVRGFRQNAVAGFAFAERLCGAGAVFAQRLFFQGATNGHWQAGQAFLENVVADPLLDALHRGFFPQRARHQHKGNILAQVSKQLESVHPRPVGQPIVGQNDVVGVCAQPQGKFLGGLHQIRADFESRLFQLVQNEVGVRAGVFNN